MNFRDLLNIFEQGATPPAAPAAPAAPAQNFGQAFAAGRKAALAGGSKTFKWTDPKTGKEVTYGTNLKKPAAASSTAPQAVNNQSSTYGAQNQAQAPTISDRAADPNVAGVAKAAPPAPPAVTPAPQTNALGVAAQANVLGSPTATAPPAAAPAEPAAAPAKTEPATDKSAANIERPLAFDQARGSSAGTPADPAGGPKPASYMYQAGKANPDYETGAGQPQWVTMNDVNSKPATRGGSNNTMQPNIIEPQDAAMPLPANVGNMNPTDSARELRAAQSSAGKPVLEPGAQVVATGTGGSTTTGTGGLLTTRSPDQIEWENRPENKYSNRPYPGAEKAAQQAADQKAAGARNLSRVKNFFGFGDKSNVKENNELSELMRLSGRTMQEKAPPGAKAERQVKHVKAGYAKDGKLTNKEKSIAYATAWKQHNKSKVSESVMLEAGSALEHIIKKFKHETKNFLAGNDLDSDLYEALFDYYSDNGEIPYGVAKARDGDPIQWVSDRFADEMQMHGYGRQTDMLNMPGHDHELTELARLAGLSESQVSECGDMDSMEQHDSMSVSTNMSSDGTKSVNISAQGDRADSLLQMLKMAGMRPYDDHEHAGMTEPEVIMISSEPQHDDMHDSMMHDEMMGEEELDEYANRPEQEYQSIDSILRQGDDLNREKAQHPVAGFTGDNPMAEEVALDEELQSLLDSILIREEMTDVLKAEQPYRDEKTGKMVTPPKGATMPPADSQFAPGDKRNVQTPKPSVKMKEQVPTAPVPATGTPGAKPAVQGVMPVTGQAAKPAAPTVTKPYTKANDPDFGNDW